MFTGIVTDIGGVLSCECVGDDTHLRIRTAYDTASIVPGASIACSGICLTVTATSSSPPLAGGTEGGNATSQPSLLLTSPRKRGEEKTDWFAVTASAETAAVTTLAGWQAGTRLNLERALKMGDELGGHLVSGHVDGVAELLAIEPDGGSHRLVLQAPPELARYIARKGSVALDGVSLTVNAVNGAEFTVNLIPHTWMHTTLRLRTPGDVLNLEVDLFARYLERLHLEPLRETG